jgi:hypothetical protein
MSSSISGGSSANSSTNVNDGSLDIQPQTTRTQTSLDTSDSGTLKTKSYPTSLRANHKNGFSVHELRHTRVSRNTAMRQYRSYNLTWPKLRNICARTCVRARPTVTHTSNLLQILFAVKCDHTCRYFSFLHVDFVANLKDVSTHVSATHDTAHVRERSEYSRTLAQDRDASWAQIYTSIVPSHQT